jgi:hypothetical protein
VAGRIRLGDGARSLSRPSQAVGWWSPRAPSTSTSTCGLSPTTHVPTIGALFLLQGVAGVILVSRKLEGLIALSRRLIPITAGAAFLAVTIVGLLLSATVGVFGFHDHLDAPLAGTSLLVEVAGVAVLALAAARSVPRAKR